MGHGANKSIFWKRRPIPQKGLLSWPGAIKSTSSKSSKVKDLVVSIDLESREYNGRWYTDVKAWKVSRAGDGAGESYPSDPQGFNNSQPSNAPVSG